MTRSELEEALTELSELARAEGIVLDLAIYGGSALVLASNFRIATQDVDAVTIGSHETTERYTAIVAARRSWPEDWLNDGVRTYLSPHAEPGQTHHTLFRSYPDEHAPGLRVFVPTARYMLAMKLMSMRIDDTHQSKDLSDILHLMTINDIKDKQDLLRLAAGFYPEARVSGKLVLGVEILWRTWRDRTPSLISDHSSDAPPRYPG